MARSAPDSASGPSSGRSRPGAGGPGAGRDGDGRGAPTGGTGDGTVRLSSARGRWVLAATVLGSGIASLDATVVNVALPAIGKDLNTGVAGLQWTLDGYLLTLAAFILIGGSLGDRFGRRRVFQIGVVWFAGASLLCGLAPTTLVLVAARALQGIGAALLTPGSLSIIQATFHPDDRGRAIGAWSGLGGLASATGPFAGGYLIDAVSWRAIFLLNLPLAVVVVLVARRHVPETFDPMAPKRVDVAGAALGAVGLGGITYALIEGPTRPAFDVLIVGAVLVGLAGLAGFVLVQSRSSHPMLPLGLFSSRQFTATNIVTLALYAALGGNFFLLSVVLQQSLGYSPIEAGASLLPVTAIMLVGSPRAGAVAQRIGPRLPMTVGPLVAGAGILLFRRIDMGSSYVATVLPAVIVFGVGLAVTVAPLTAAVLSAVEARHAGVASGVNNAMARIGGLLAVAVLPLAAGIMGDDYRGGPALVDGFHRAVLITAGLAIGSGLLAWLMVRDPSVPGPVDERHDAHCSIDAPPLRLARR